MSQRDHSFDNLKFLLILSVVLGHWLVRLEPEGWGVAYRLIFSFHMPLFLFVSGWFGRFRAGKVLELVGLYVLFQTVWFCFDTLVMGEHPQLQFSKPSWSLWYLMALAFYTLLTPLYDVEPNRRPLVIAVTAGLALAAGFDESIGSLFAVSRFLVFQPFYVAGYYGRRSERFLQKPRGLQWLPLSLGIALAVWVAVFSGFRGRVFYGLDSYAALGIGPLTRGLVMAAAAVWVYVFMVLVRPLMLKKLPILTRLGANSLPIYLFHGFAMDLLEKLPLPRTWPMTLLLTAVCMLLCGCPWAGKLLAWVTVRRRKA